MPSTWLLPQLLPFHTIAYSLLLAALVCATRIISWLDGWAASCMCTGSPLTGAVMVWMADQLVPFQVAYDRPAVPVVPLAHTSIASPLTSS